MRLAERAHYQQIVQLVHAPGQRLPAEVAVGFVQYQRMPAAAQPCGQLIQCIAAQRQRCGRVGIGKGNRAAIYQFAPRHAHGGTVASGSEKNDAYTG